MYAVRKGRKTGIYATWEECKEQVAGISGAEFKKFKNEEDARKYVEGINIQGKYVYAVKNTNTIYKTWEECKEAIAGLSGAEYRKFRTESEAYDWLRGLESSKMGIANFQLPTLYIDGSYENSKGRISFGIVLVANGQESIFMGRTTGGMGNISGELGAMVLSLHLLKKLGIKTANIIYDYEGVYKWLSGDFKCRNDEVKEYVNFCKQFIEDNEMKLYFYKCKSHSGNIMNNKADKAAKRAINEGKMYQHNDIYNKDFVLA